MYIKAEEKLKITALPRHMYNLLHGLIGCSFEAYGYIQNGKDCKVFDRDRIERLIHCTKCYVYLKSTSNK